MTRLIGFQSAPIVSARDKPRGPGESWLAMALPDVSCRVGAGMSPTPNQSTACGCQACYPRQTRAQPVGAGMSLTPNQSQHAGVGMSPKPD